MMATKVQKAGETRTTEQLGHKELEKRGEPVEQLISFSLNKDLMKAVQVKALISKEVRNRLLEFLHRNADIFAWSISNMPRIFSTSSLTT